jgi:rubrerythrin
MKKDYLKNLFAKFISVEVESYSMYKKMAEYEKRPALKELFLTLSDEELKHKELFEKMDVAKVMIKNEEKLEILRIDGINKNHISDKELKDIKNAIDFAIKLEEDSYETYQKLSKYIEEGEERFAVLEVAKQELKHKQKLILAKKDFE